LTRALATDNLKWFRFASILEPDMPVNLSIKNAPEKVVRKLKKRAERNHRSLQGELMAIITEAVEEKPPLTAAEILRRTRALGLTSPSESASIIRADRDAR
jgi:plasmid stability protein